MKFRFNICLGAGVLFFCLLTMGVHARDPEKIFVASEKPFGTFPLGEKIKFKVTYAGITVGEAESRVKEIVRINGRRTAEVKIRGQYVPVPVGTWLGASHALESCIGQKVEIEHRGMVAVRVIVRRDDHSRALYTRPHDALRGDTDVVSQATERFYKRYRIDAQVDQRGQGHVT